MNSFVLLTTIIGVVFSATLDDEWELWKIKYNKQYEDEAVESVRPSHSMGKQLAVCTTAQQRGT